LPAFRAISRSLNILRAGNGLYAIALQQQSVLVVKLLFPSLGQSIPGCRVGSAEARRLVSRTR